MKRLLLFLLLTSAAAGFGCDSSSTSGDTGTFQASLFDASGTLVLGGELRLVIEAEGSEDAAREVTGSWQLEGRNGQADPVPASGTLRGRLLGNGITLSLDQEAADVGTDLTGTYEGSRIAGTWSTITIAGPVPQGAFEAERD